MLLSSKPNLVDINDDGHLDLIYGERSGAFIQFHGTAAKGINHFSNEPKLLEDINAKPLHIKSREIVINSSPHFIDWDGDKDLDLITGSASGAIYFSENVGNAKEPKWAVLTEWLPPTKLENTNHMRGRHHIQNS